ncbi:MAG: cohesin domain-containing protein [Patescibacteria group bacterium]
MKRFFVNSFIYTLSCSLLLLLNTTAASAASLYFEPNTAVWSVGSNQMINLHISSDGEVVNLVQATIQYPPDVVEVIAVYHGGSSLTLWPEEPSINAAAGSITFAAGIPNGSLIDTGQVLTLEVRPKQAGTVQFSFNPNQTAVYLNDGLATQTTVSFKEPVYDIISAAPVSLIVTSATHPDENKWYQLNEFSAQWEKKPDALYSFHVTSDLEQLPDDIADDTPQVVTGEYTISNLSDGVHYFMIKEWLSNEAGWAEPVIRKIMVDSTPPTSFIPLVSQTEHEFNGQPFLVFDTSDSVSGIDHYEIVKGGTTTIITKGPYQLEQKDITQPILIRAVDAANNSTTVYTGENATNIRRNYFWPITALVAFLALLLVYLKTRLS